MSLLYRSLIRPVLFRQDSEKIHDRTIRLLGTVSHSRALCGLVALACDAPDLPIRILGLSFPNPVGLAAGMDKQAAAVPVWRSMGFGFSELGGVTAHPQPGNPAPRMFRAIRDEALINRMGFNNGGAEAMAARLRQWRDSGRWPRHPVGMNLGKSKITPNERAAEDYAQSFRWLRDLCDFFVVNVSSPNTPNLRALQDKAALDDILCTLQELNHGAGASRDLPSPRPILVKVAPDLSLEALDEILDLAMQRNLAGIVATNTTIARPESTDARLRKIYGETGGLSGRPLRARSTEIIRHIFDRTGARLPVIGVGGIFSAADAWEKIVAGASLVQVYTGMVFEGPTLAKEIVTGLKARLERAGFSELQEAVGRRDLAGISYRA